MDKNDRLAPETISAQAFGQIDKATGESRQQFICRQLSYVIMTTNYFTQNIVTVGMKMRHIMPLKKF